MFLSNFSHIKQNSLWILDKLFDLLQESYCLPTVNNPMVIGKSNIHDWSSLNLSVDDNWSEFGCVHTQNSTLWRINDWGSHH